MSELSALAEKYVTQMERVEQTDALIARHERLQQAQRSALNETGEQLKERATKDRPLVMVKAGVNLYVLIRRDVGDYKRIEVVAASS